MVCRVNHDTDNAQHRLLTIQHPCDSKWREKKDLEDEENSTEQVDGSMSDIGTFIPLLDVSSGGRTNLCAQPK